MERYRAFETTLTNGFPPELQAALFTKIFTGEIEIVHYEDTTTAWADSAEAEDVLIDAMRGGHVVAYERFPRRWAETTDLEVYGDLSLDGTKKVVDITPDNLSSHVTLLKEYPDGYRVTSEYLESLDYTGLKNLIRRYPELDAELNLSLSKAVLLEATKEYFGLGDVI